MNGLKGGLLGSHEVCLTYGLLGGLLDGLQVGLWGGLKGGDFWPLPQPEKMYFYLSFIENKKNAIKEFVFEGVVGQIMARPRLSIYMLNMLYML